MANYIDPVDPLADDVEIFTIGDDDMWCDTHEAFSAVVESGTQAECDCCLWATLACGCTLNEPSHDDELPDFAGLTHAERYAWLTYHGHNVTAWRTDVSGLWAYCRTVMINADEQKHREALARVVGRAY